MRASGPLLRMKPVTVDRVEHSVHGLYQRTLLELDS